MKKTNIFLPLLAALLMACNSTPHFKVKGSITDAGGMTLYIDHVGVSANEPLDSTTLDEGGHFSFTIGRYADPEFFRLRIGMKYEADHRQTDGGACLQRLGGRDARTLQGRRQGKLYLCLTRQTVFLLRPVHAHQ